jgi:MOSC domain-containing protein YiiM
MSNTRKKPLSGALVSLQVGVPRNVHQQGEVISTGIFKVPVTGRVRMRHLNLDGDQQADLTVHGGQDKAVYAYPSEHYPFWKKELPGVDFPWGSFGENLTTSGLLENEVFLGDRYRIGTAEVVVTQPRLPCFKLNLKFGRDDMIKRFLHSGHTGFYFRVLLEGEVGAGDEIVRVQEDENRVSVKDAFNLYIHGLDSGDVRERALRVPYLSASWREEFSVQS